MTRGNHKNPPPDRRYDQILEALGEACQSWKDTQEKLDTLEKQRNLNNQELSTHNREVEATRTAFTAAQIRILRHAINFIRSADPDYPNTKGAHHE